MSDETATPTTIEQRTERLIRFLNVVDFEGYEGDENLAPFVLERLDVLVRSVRSLVLSEIAGAYEARIAELAKYPTALIDVDWLISYLQSKAEYARHGEDVG